MELWLLPSDLFNLLVAALQFRDDCFAAALGQVGMGIGMILNLMSRICQSFHRFRVLIHPLAHQKEGGLHLIFPQYFNQLFRILIPPGECFVAAERPSSLSFYPQYENTRICTAPQERTPCPAAFPALVRGSTETAMSSFTLPSFFSHKIYFLPFCILLSFISYFYREKQKHLSLFRSLVSIFYFLPSGHPSTLRRPTFPFV